MTTRSIIGGLTAAALLLASVPSFAYDRDGYEHHGERGRVVQRAGGGWQGHREWREHEHHGWYGGGYVYQQPAYVYQQPDYVYQQPAYVYQQPYYQPAPGYYYDNGVDPGEVAALAIIGGIAAAAVAHH